jgi:hypothetical protein
MTFAFYFYDLESLVEKGNGMESNDQRRHFLSVLHVIYFMLCEWELNPCIFSRLPDEHFLTCLALSSHLYIKSMSTHRELLT